MSRIEKSACTKFEDDLIDWSVQFVQIVQKSTEKKKGKQTSLHFILLYDTQHAIYLFVSILVRGIFSGLSFRELSQNHRRVIASAELEGEFRGEKFSSFLLYFFVAVVFVSIFTHLLLDESVHVRFE